MFPRRHALLLLLLPAMLLAQTPPGQQTPAKKEPIVKKLRIQVTAKDSGLPLAQVKVHLSSAGGKSAESSPTGADGTVTFSNIRSGPVRLRVTSPGWKDFGNAYDLSPQEKVTIAVQLLKEGESQSTIEEKGKTADNAKSDTKSEVK